MSSLENIVSPQIEDDRMAVTPPPQPTGRVKPRKSTPGAVDLSVFEILNTFRRRWFLSRANLLANAISSQKDEDGNISSVEFTPHFHSHLVKCAVVLVPHPVSKVKRVMFGFILELLNGEGNLAFFDLQKGGRKANNAQKEKRRLARKRSRAAKRERDREAAKAAKLPPRMRKCMSCGREFASRKTARRHNCPNSKVVRKPVEAADGTVSRPNPPAQLGKPTTTITPLAPSGPSHRPSSPAVTGDPQGQSVHPLPGWEYGVRQLDGSVMPISASQYDIHDEHDREIVGRAIVHTYGRKRSRMSSPEV